MSNTLNHLHGRRGNTLLTAVILIPALVAIISLAVDLGRMQVAKAELQNAADAAARWAVKGLDDGSAVAKAKAAAAANSVAGSALVLEDADIALGNWDQALSPVFDPTRSPTNAAQVVARRTASRGTQVPLFFASVIGVAGGELAVTSIAKLDPRIETGFVAIGNLGVKNNLTAATYDSSNYTDPSSTKYDGGAVIAANGSVTAKNNEAVETVALGPAGSHNLTLARPTIYLAANITSPTLDFSGAPSANPGGVSQNFTVSGNTILAAGTYYFKAITIKNNAALRFSGEATVYVDGNISFENYGEISAFNNIPSNLRIFQRGAGTIFGGADANIVSLTGDLVAPQSTFVVKNNGVIKGAALVKTFDALNNLELYYDTQLNHMVETGSPSIGPISTVR